MQLALTGRELIVKHRRSGIVLLLAGTFAFMAVRFLWLVSQFAVDMLFLDGWDLWDGFFRHADVWTLWRVQHGPQRQGLAQWVLAVIVRTSGWSVRAEALGGGVIIVLAAAVGLAIARSLRGRWSVSDGLIPVALLSASLVSVATVVPNLAHGPLPVLLVLTCAYFAQVRHERTRVLGVAITMAISMQTGFTWLLTVVVVPLQLVLLVAAVRARRRARDHVLGLVLVLASLAHFLHGFRFEPAVPCFRFPDPQPWRYFGFIAVMVQHMMMSTARNVGVVGALLGLGLALWSAWATIASAGRNRLAASVLVLSAFSLTFAANTAVGRVCLGYEAGKAGRYVPYTLLLVMACYLFIALFPRLGRLRPALLIALLALLVVKETVHFPAALVEPRHYARIKVAFRDCLLAQGTFASCSKRISVHPNPVAARIPEKLEYLRAYRLGLFRQTP